jgi:hypothetical protein
MSGRRLAQHLRSLSPPWVVQAPAPGPGALRAELGGAMRLLEVDGRGCAGKAALLRALASALDAPPHFGGTWDALADCLRDLSWQPPAEGYALVLAHAEHILAAEPPERETLLSVLELAGEHWAGERRPFHAVLSRGSGAPAGPTAWRVPAIEL